MSHRPWFVAGFVLVSASCAAAQEQPTFICQSAGDQMIIARAVPGSVGYEFLSRKATGDWVKDCGAESRDGDTYAGDIAVACRMSDGKALVSVSLITETLGERFLLRDAGDGGPERCSPARRDGDVAIGDETTSLHFSDIKGGRLLLENSTGPTGDLLLYDLATGRKLVEAKAVDDFSFDADRLVYWERTGEAVKADCAADYDQIMADFGAVAKDVRKTFDGTSGIVTTGSETRCSPLQ